MKINQLNLLITITLLLFFTTSVFSQEKDSTDVKPNTPVSVAKLDTTAVGLSINWKFHSGDDTTWAEKNFNDSGWVAIDPELKLDRTKMFPDRI